MSNPSGLVAELMEWSAGVALGRFDLRLATGERAAPPEPDPFDPLPVCSPGMLTGDDRLPLEVRPKCAKDRSLAIAHGLEGVFREEDDDGKWRARVQGAGFRVQEVVEKLVRERTSAAVKDALKGLLEAPAPVTRRGGGRRSTVRGPSRRAGAASQTGDGGRARSSGGASAAIPDAATLDAVRQAIAAGNGGVSKSDVLAATGLTDALWNAAINALLADGTVSKTGAGRGTRYHVNPEP